MRKAITISLAGAALMAAGIGAVSQAQGGPASGMDREARSKMVKAELEARLTDLDANGDGEITRAEVDARREAEFTTADTNADGVLSSDEAKAFRAARMAERQDNRSDRMFARADQNESGTLELDEFGQRQVQLFDRFDADGDGAVTEAEIQAGVEAMAERRGKRRFGRGGER